MKPAGAAMTAGKGARSGYFSKRSGTLFLYELRKIAETRFLPAFLLLFLLAGCYIAGNKPIFFQKEALDSLNDITAAYGVKITDETRETLLKEQAESWEQVEALYRKTYGEPEEGLEAPADLIFSMLYEKGGYGLTEEEKAFLWRADTVNSLSPVLIPEPKDLQISASPSFLKTKKETAMEVLPLAGAEKELFLSAYTDLEKQSEILSKEGAGATLFPNKEYVHESLYSLIRFLLIFSLLFLLLIFSFSMNQEFASRTAPLVYSTLHGRRYWKYPALASAACGLVGSMLIFAVPLAVYVSRTGYGLFWDAYLTSSLSTQLAVPFAPLTLGQYFLLTLSICALLLVFFTLLLMSVSFFARSSLGTIAAFAAVFGVFLLPAYILPLWLPKVIAQCSPFAMLMRCGDWFCSLFQTQIQDQYILLPYLPGQDAYTLLGWALLLTGLFLCARRYFLRRASL